MTLPYQNALTERMRRSAFVVSIEFVTPLASEEFEASIAPAIELAERVKGDSRIHTIAVTDRVKSDDDHDPVRVAQRVAEASGKVPTVHFAGKGRDSASVLDSLERARAAGLDNLLLITGDRVKSQAGDRRVRYYDSVNMIADARSLGAGLHVAAAVSPFKYREEELMNQYLKMAKKERAGADCFITQVGWDMPKLKELAAYRRSRGLTAPVMGGLMLLTVGRARYIRTHKLAGITVTDELQAFLETEASWPDKGIAAAYRRLALQVVGLKRLGYAGFQLTGMQQFEKLDQLLRMVHELEQEFPTEAEWWDGWWAALRGPTGRPIATAPSEPLYLYRELEQRGGSAAPLDSLTPTALPGVSASSRESQKFSVLDLLDRVVFKETSLGAAVLRPLARLVPPDSPVDRGLHRVEQFLKKPIVGCDTCGFCRLPHTMFVCPETCPKGLANGPCGGTSDNMCEFGDRECIHNHKYRLAKMTRRTDELEAVLIPAVDPARRGTCSWTSHFRGDGPLVTHLSHRDAKGAQHDH
jgi:methylenetetrahydrofolate reductase (NADPH)